MIYVGGFILEDTQHENILEEQRKILKGKDLEKLVALIPGRKHSAKICGQPRFMKLMERVKHECENFEV
ncbi:MAG: hypothetical protein GTN73_03205, partial [Candidatus Aminicenantes bacterium]|nr:hypothetical protein [Candidatus Aminicenantes bacterium]